MVQRSTRATTNYVKISSEIVYCARSGIPSTYSLGSCWIQIRKRAYDETTTSEDYIKDSLNMPSRMNVESIVAIGYPAEKREPVPKKISNTKKFA